MKFGSDNMVGASELVMRSILEANAGYASSYGADDWSLQAEKRLMEVFETPLKAFFVSTGTAANCIGLASMVDPWGIILSHKKAHILIDESTAPEFFTGGARFVGLPDVGDGGKLTPEGLHQFFRSPLRVPHNAQPQVLSLTQLSESGLRYTPSEIAELSAIAHAQGLKVHMDGARLANAIVDTPYSLADYTHKAGVDVLTMGASKNGALMAEAIIFFDQSLCATTALRIKRSGQMAAKGRFFGAQFLAWLADDHWLHLARHANQMAQRLTLGLQTIPQAHIVWQVDGNELFVLLPQSMVDAARAAGASFYDWYEDTLPVGMQKQADQAFVRLVCSFATAPEKVDELIAFLKNQA